MSICNIGPRCWSVHTWWVVDEVDGVRTSFELTSSASTSAISRRLASSRVAGVSCVSSSGI